MPKIFEVFGYPLSVQNPDAIKARQNALCPFMGGDCDGGGNRYLSQVDLTKNSQLQSIFPKHSKVPAGACSIQLKDNESPWIVCPRRLLVLGREKAIGRAHQTEAENEVIRLLGYSKGTKLGVWSEVILKFDEKVEGISKSFDYTFDYITMPIGRVKLADLAKSVGNLEVLKSKFENAGYAIALREGEYFVEDCPIGIPSIVEIMTSSTSGGNKTKRTTIPQSFEDAILGKKHEAPSINKRQVWARMVSQLIVKSEVGIHWGGKTLWLIQDNLAQYISESTALDLQKFLSINASEVNMLSFSYGSQYKNPSDVINLRDHELYAGNISSSVATKPSFQDMIRAPIKPDVKRLVARLAESKPVSQFIV